MALGVNVTVNDRLSGLMARVAFLKSFEEVTVPEFACSLSLTIIFPLAPTFFHFCTISCWNDFENVRLSPFLRRFGGHFGRREYDFRPETSPTFSYFISGKILPVFGS